METVLNLIWALLVVAALCVWQRRWVRQKAAARRNPLQEWTAFVCLMVMMFFVVSMTDNLHPEIFLCDGSSGGRRISLVRPSAHRPPVKRHTASSSSIAVPPHVDTASSLVVFGAISPFERIAILFSPSDPSAARAPPFDR
ncbi:MAG: hypothetical protein WBF35_13855 [Candidatus Acidiferrales bacterium]